MANLSWVQGTKVQMMEIRVPFWPGCLHPSVFEKSSQAGIFCSRKPFPDNLGNPVAPTAMPAILHGGSRFLAFSLTRLYVLSEVSFVFNFVAHSG